MKKQAGYTFSVLSATKNMSWDNDHYEYTCADGEHNSFWKTVIESPQWKAWRTYALKNLLYDIYEVEECGWISPKHFQAFLKFQGLNQAKQRDE